MKKILIVTLSLLSLLSLSQISVASGSVSASPKATATLAAVCTISAQNVNFGQISLPVSGQSATSNMVVQCTKGSSYTIALAYGGVYGTTNTQTVQHVYGFCSGYSPPYPQACLYSTTSTVSYAYGKMTGAAKGDSIGYSIQVPNNPGQVWNVGNYSYTTTGTGSNQSIPVVATLMPSQTANQYPTADSYADTVTATITY